MKTIMIKPENYKLVKMMNAIYDIIYSSLIGENVFHGILIEGKKMRKIEALTHLLSKKIGRQMEQKEASNLERIFVNILEDNDVSYSKEGYFIQNKERIIFVKESPLDEFRKVILIEGRQIFVSLTELRREGIKEKVLELGFNFVSSKYKLDANWNQPVKAFYKIVKTAEKLLETVSGYDYLVFEGADKARYELYKAYLIKKKIDFSFLDDKGAILIKL